MMRSSFASSSLLAFAVAQAQVPFTEHHGVCLYDQGIHRAAWSVDMDQDGDPDLLNITSTRLQWHPNKGNDTYAEPVVIVASSGGATLALYEDLDGDGLLDIIATCLGDYTVSWFQGLPGQQFAQRAVLAEFDGIPHRLQVVDVDGDLDLDLVAGFTQTNGPEGRWWRNEGNLSFGAAETIYTTDSPYTMNDILLADVDNDLTQDAIIVTGNRVLTRLNSGNGSFAPQQAAIPHSPGTRRVAMVDLDTDGDLDMAVAFGQSVVVYANNGNGTFTNTGAPLTGLSDARSLFTAELVENATTELVVLDDVGATDLIRVITAGPGPVLTSMAPLTVAGSATHISAGSCNADGTTDLIYCGGAMGYYPRTAPDTFGEWPVLAYSSVSWPTHVTIGELNGDGLPDIVLSSLSSVEHFPGDGSTNFGPRGRPVPLPWTRDITTLDDNGDGADEVFVCFEQTNGGVKRLTNDGGVLSLGQSVITATTTVNYLARADVDEAGIEDLLFVRAWNNHVGVLYHMENGSFLNVVTGTPQLPAPSMVFAADMDGDGAKDLVRDVLSTTSDIQWHPNNTVGGFPPALPTGSVLDPSMELVGGFTVGRLNDDAFTDVVASINDGVDRLVLLFNNGLGTSWSMAPLAEDLVVRDLWVVDLDQNGRNDIVGLVPDASAPWVWMADGEGTFAPGMQLDSVLTEVFDIAIGDLDNDGDPDILATGTGGGAIFWYENTSGVPTSTAQRARGARGLSIHPNPAADQVAVERGDGFALGAEYRLFNELGGVVLSGPLQRHVDRIAVGDLAPGPYVLEVRSATAVERVKLMIQR